jgi:DTW domain-containing protein YfiP
MGKKTNRLEHLVIEESKQSERPSLAMTLPVEQMSNRLEVVILQHPQEPDKVLGTAPLCVRSLKNASLRVGLSWPSLAKAIGHEAMPSEWGVVYLGGKGKELSQVVNVLNKKMEPVENPLHLKGIILLDGTWSQAKTLWWRNAWLLKLRRVVLQPEKPSIYGRLRKEPRRECVSTIEAVALCLQYFDAGSKIGVKLEENFARMLETYREQTGP